MMYVASATPRTDDIATIYLVANVMVCNEYYDVLYCLHLLLFTCPDGQQSCTGEKLVVAPAAAAQAGEEPVAPNNARTSH
jgi:hypothetical protein